MYIVSELHSSVINLSQPELRALLLMRGSLSADKHFQGCYGIKASLFSLTKTNVSYRIYLLPMCTALFPNVSSFLSGVVLATFEVRELLKHDIILQMFFLKISVSFYDTKHL